MSDAVDFLQADRYERLQKIDAKIPKVSKIASLQCLYNIFKKKLDFLDVDKHQNFL